MGTTSMDFHTAWNAWREAANGGLFEAADEAGGRMTGFLFPFKSLFSPLQLNDMTLINRVIMMPAEATSADVARDRTAEQWAVFYARRAQGGAGLIVSERVAPEHWRRVAQSVHAAGARYMVALTADFPRWHGAPWQVRAIVEAIASSAQKARRASVDGVVLDGRPKTALARLQVSRLSWKKDDDGDRPLGLAAVRAVRRAIGHDVPILYRIGFDLQSEEDIDAVLDDMACLVAAGVDGFVVEVTSAVPRAVEKPGLALDVCRIVKHYFSEGEHPTLQGHPVAIVAVGKLGYPDLAEQAVAEDMCDAVALDRALLADPDWARKAYAGRVESIRPCLNDAVEDDRRLGEMARPFCAVRASSPKTVAVVGAGPAGFECAMTALERGHTVHLFDNQPNVGGAAQWVAVPRHRHDVRNYLCWMERTLEHARLMAGERLVVHLDTVATLTMLADGQYDAVVCATGARRLDLPDGEHDRFVAADTLLMDPSLLDGHDNIIVIGDALDGFHVAYWLVDEHDAHVAVVTATPATADLEERAARWRGIMERRGIRLLDDMEGFQADLIVLAGDRASDLSFYKLLNDASVAPELFLVGDGARPGSIAEAAMAGHLAGCAL